MRVGRMMIGLMLIGWGPACKRPYEAPTHAETLPKDDEAPARVSALQLPGDVFAYNLRVDTQSLLSQADAYCAWTRRYDNPQRLAEGLADRARILASGGNYADAVAAAREALALATMRADDVAVFSDAIRLWTILALSSDGISNDFVEDLHLRNKSVLTAPWPWPDVELTDSARDTLTRLRGLRDTSTKMALAALRAHAGFPEMDDSLLEAPAALCGSMHEDCILRDMAAFSLDLRAGAPERAREHIVIRRQDARTVEAGVLTMLEGDILSAPRSSPLLLNLRPLDVSQAVLKTRAGLASSLPDAVAPDALAEASALYGAARTAFEREGFVRGLAHIDAREAYVAFARHDFEAAAERFAGAALGLRRSGDVVASAWAELAAAGASLAMQDERKAEGHVHRAGRLVGEYRLSGVAALLVQQLNAWASELAIRLGNGHAAASAYGLAAWLAKASELPRLHLWALQVHADYLSDLGRAEEAAFLLEELLAAVNVQIEVTSPESDASELALRRLSTLFSLYSIHMALGDPVKARARVEQLAAASEAVVGPLNRQPRASTSEWQLRLLEGRLEDALQAAREARDDVGVAVSSVALDRTRDARLAARRVAEAALASPRQAGPSADLLMRQSARQSLETAISLLVLAGDHARAEQVWKRGEPEGVEPFLFLQPGKTWERNLTLAKLHQALGRPDAATEALERGFAQLDAFVAGLGTEFERAGFYEKVASVYREAAEHYFKTDRPIDALGVLESAQARTFHAQLFGSLSTAKGAHQEATQHWLRAQARLAALRRAQMRGTSASVSPSEVENAQARLDAAEERVLSFLGSALPKDDPMSGAELVAAAAAALPRKPSALVVYYLGNRASYVSVIAPEGLRVTRRLDVQSRRLREAAGRLWALLDARVGDWQDPARVLYEALIRPIEADLPLHHGRAAPANLGFVVYNDTFTIPFQILLDVEGRPMLDAANIFYIPSLRSYPRLVEAARTGRIDEVHAFGYNAGTLRYAEAEAKDVATSELGLTGADATTANFAARARNPQALHLSMHAVADRGNPFEAELVFSDRPLPLHELLGMEVKSRLVTLHVCDANAGYVSATGDRASLARTFLAHGVPTVVTSEWRVADHPALGDLFKRFYARVRRGEAPLEALAVAQRELKVSGAPVWDWGVFQVVGSDR